ncbi:MAG: hypothetical protein GXO62_00765 [Epsilonproteobacteria bacterium]|nr:hypothetical protein [Campylobacterota bacterium]
MSKNELLKSLVKEVFEPLNEDFSEDIFSDTSFYRVFGIYKIAVLPLLNEEEYQTEIARINKIYGNDRLILDEKTRVFFDTFLDLHSRWLEKYKIECQRMDDFKKSLVKKSERQTVEDIIKGLEDYTNLLKSKQSIDTEGIEILTQIEKKSEDMDNFSEILGRMIDFIFTFDPTTKEPSQIQKAKEKIEEIFNKLIIWLKDEYIKGKENLSLYVNILANMAKLELIYSR